MADCHCDSCKLDTIIQLLTTQGERIMALQDDLNAVTTQLGKVKDEILAKISDLDNSIDNLEQTVADNADAAAELDAAKNTVAGLRDAAQALDDVVPDPEPPAE